MPFNKEMQRALEADGEKLRQLTGEDHGPWPISNMALTISILAAADEIEGLCAKLERYRSALSWMGNQDPQLVNAAREKFELKD